MKEFPEKGLTKSDVRRALQSFQDKIPIVNGAMPGMLDVEYHLAGMPELLDIALDAFPRFMETNASNTIEMEEDIVSMIGKLWNHSSPVGNITTGGTESNFLALRGAVKQSGRRGKVVVPSTIHPSVFKGCDWLGLEPVVVPVEENLIVDSRLIEEAITEETIALFATCGVDPYGTIDPIEDISKIAKEHDLYLHVDAAFGGLYCPWLVKLGFDMPKFDFQLEGVTSISTDPHKNGYGIYPTGCILYRDQDTKKAVSFDYGSTPTRHEGQYALTPTILGTRPSAGIAVSWAIFSFLGVEGFMNLTRKCEDLLRAFLDDLELIPGIEPAAHTKTNLLALMSRTIELGPIKKDLRKRGWRFLSLDGRPKTFEDCFVLVFVPSNAHNFPILAKDLREIVTKK